MSVSKHADPRLHEAFEYIKGCASKSLVVQVRTRDKTSFFVTVSAGVDTFMYQHCFVTWGLITEPYNGMTKIMRQAREGEYTPGVNHAEFDSDEDTPACDTTETTDDKIQDCVKPDFQWRALTLALQYVWMFISILSVLWALCMNPYTLKAWEWAVANSVAFNHSS